MQITTVTTVTTVRVGGSSLRFIHERDVPETPQDVAGVVMDLLEESGEQALLALGGLLGVGGRGVEVDRVRFAVDRVAAFLAATDRGEVLLVAGDLPLQRSDLGVLLAAVDTPTTG